MHASKLCLSGSASRLPAILAPARWYVQAPRQLQMCAAMPGRLQCCRHAGTHLRLHQHLDLLSMLELQLLQSAQVLPLQVSHMLIMLRNLMGRCSLQ